MSKLVFEACERCGETARIEVDAVNGRLVERLVSGCDHEKRRRRLCLACMASIADRDKRASLCHGCAAARNLKSRRDGHRKWVERTRPEFNAKRREEYHANPEPKKRRNKEYYWQNPDRERDRGSRKYYFSNPLREKLLARKRAYHRENRERINARARQRRAEKRAEREAARAAADTPEKQRAA